MNSVLHVEFDPGAKYVYRDKWTATLSDGSKVYEDRVPGELSAWIRLREYLKETGLKMVGLELYANKLNFVMPPNPEGYWQSKRCKRWAGNYSHEVTECGVGYLKDDKIYIKWACPHRITQEEVRDYSPGDPAVIIST